MGSGKIQEKGQFEGAMQYKLSAVSIGSFDGLTIVQDVNVNSLMGVVMNG